MLKCKGKQSRASYGVPVRNRIWRAEPTVPTLKRVSAMLVLSHAPPTCDL